MPLRLCKEGADCLGQTYLKYPLAFFLPFLVTYLFTWIIIRVAPRLGLLDEPRARHAHGSTTPTSGGIALFLGFHTGCAVVFLYPWSKFVGSLDVEWWVGVLTCSSLLLVIGVMDDRWGISPISANLFA